MPIESSQSLWTYSIRPRERGINSATIVVKHSSCIITGTNRGRTFSWCFIAYHRAHEDTIETGNTGSEKQQQCP